MLTPMPRLTARPLFTAPGVTVRHVTCDGVDPPRPTEEGGDDARVVIVMQGRFAFEDGGGRGVASPAAGLFLPAGHTYRIRHVDGGDTSIAVQGACCDALLEAGPICRRLSVSGFLSIRELAARLLRGEAHTRLAVEEIVASALDGDRASTDPISPRERAVADAIAYELERDIDARLGLATLASKGGVSVFHACRVFKRVTGLGIHQYHRELRLRHALAWLLDTRRPLARIALDAGFANQAHLTNAFRRRFGTTPGRVRATGICRREPSLT